MLKQFHSDDHLTEAGSDEAGRGCLAGPVFAAAVILPENFNSPKLNDSKQLSKKHRDELRMQIEQEALSWCVASVSPSEIDSVNILNASIMAMHKAISGLCIRPQLLLIDGNRFKPYPEIHHECIIRGDSLYMSIAAASILAKTHRDEFMQQLHAEFPQYGWNHNMGYPTEIHRKAIRQYGQTVWHRKSFRMNEQIRLEF